MCTNYIKRYSAQLGPLTPIKLPGANFDCSKVATSSARRLTCGYKVRKSNRTILARNSPRERIAKQTDPEKVRNPGMVDFDTRITCH
jgi:hypothetical protein